MGLPVLVKKLSSGFRHNRNSGFLGRVNCIDFKCRFLKTETYDLNVITYAMRKITSTPRAVPQKRCFSAILSWLGDFENNFQLEEF